jgi:plastocyanin
MSSRRRIPILRTVAAGSALAAAVLVAGCGSSHPASSTNAPRTVPSTIPDTALGSPTTSAPKIAGGNVITIKNFSFGAPITVAPGAKVMVHNADSTTHSLSSDNGSFDAGDSVAPGQTRTFVAPSKPGTYAFHCNFHAEMHGTLVVTG